MSVATSPHPAARRGITVLEVLISIGILAIGLTSALGILAAARTQAARTVILDRASLHAANVLADAATMGLFRANHRCFAVLWPTSGTWNGITWSGTIQPDGTWAGNEWSLTEDPQKLHMISSTSDTTSTWQWQIPKTRSATMVFDSFNGYISRNPRILQNSVSARLRADHYYGSGNAVGATSPMKWLLSSRDDIVVSASPASADDPPLNNVPADAMRQFEGEFTSLFCLSGTGAGPFLASVVVFYNRRDVQIGHGGYNTVDTPQVMCTMASGTLTVRTQYDLRARELSQIVRPGAVVWVPSRLHGEPGTFHQLTSVSFVGAPTRVGPNTVARVFLSSNKDPAFCAGPGPFEIQVLADSVGLAERPFVPESAEAFTQ
jgi:Tfp pilus assembly protein PilV